MALLSKRMVFELIVRNQSAAGSVVFLGCRICSIIFLVIDYKCSEDCQTTSLQASLLAYYLTAWCKKHLQLVKSLALISDRRISNIQYSTKLKILKYWIQDENRELKYHIPWNILSHISSTFFMVTNEPLTLTFRWPWQQFRWKAGFIASGVDIYRFFCSRMFYY